MIVVPLQVTTVPVLVALWALDGCLLLIIAGFLLGTSARGRRTEIYAAIDASTRPALALVRRWTHRLIKRPVSERVLLCVLGAGLTVLRQILVLVLSRMS